MTAVWAGMATLMERGSRHLAVDSLLPQVDRLIVADGGERGDQAKFLGCADAPDDVVFLGVDDDLIYPPDYVENIVAGVERYPDAIVSHHGWSMRRDKEGELELYARNHRCLENVWDDEEVHVAGTGVCAFRISTIRPEMDWFESINADVWLSLRAEKLGVRRVVLAHPSFWLGYCQVPMARTIYTHTAYETGSSLDGSEGKARAIRELSELLDLPADDEEEAEDDDAET